MTPLEEYLSELSRIRSSGAAVAEISYYTPLSNLFNTIGSKLKPKVRCIINISNKGAGIPDGGFFTPDQFQKATAAEPLPGQLPSRGVIEIKSTADDISAVAKSKQVKKYLNKYGQVLVTNYRDFLLLSIDSSDNPLELEPYHLSESESAFWAEASHPKSMAKRHDERFEEYIKRVMLHGAPLNSPEEVAWYLASYAKEAQSRIENIELPALRVVRQALEEALGITFEGDRGEHFFRSTLVQTLFYGVFSAWVLWCKDTNRKKQFDWRMAEWSLHVPFIKTLYEQIATPSHLSSLRLVEILNWTTEVLNRVDQSVFFAKFEEENAVIYFYEPFLKAFDPELRKQLGVWYTPKEIVQYQVERVDTVLREELGIEDGLADNRVYVLDPCCGTGAYLVEVLKSIAKTLEEKGGDALTKDDIKQAALERVFGFEILPAPFVVSHLQLGLLLKRFGIPLAAEGNERVGVYLTNSLTGWEPPIEPKTHLLFPELEEERDAADEVKLEKPILVILGNPPYNAFAGVSSEEEQGLVDVYKKGLISEWRIKKFNLDDLYIRFFRLAEKRIAEVSGKGIVCYISNFSYLGDPSFVVMRKRLLDGFDKLWFDCMNGDSRETGKKTPDGKPDPSIFSTKQDPVGIKIGTAIALLVRKEDRRGRKSIRFKHYWGIEKKQNLLNSLKLKRIDTSYQNSSPRRSNRYSFKPLNISDDYLSWPLLIEMCIDQPLVGMEECRNSALIDINRTALEDRIKKYYDPDVSIEEIKTVNQGLARSPNIRLKALDEEKFESNNIEHYTVRPFDIRWAYYSTVSGLWNRSRPELNRHHKFNNYFIISRFNTEASPEGTPFYLSRHLFDKQTINRNPGAIPVYVAAHDKNAKKDKRTVKLFSGVVANLSESSRKYLAGLSINKNPDDHQETAYILWLHTMAIGYSSQYLTENADGLSGDWPRIPLPNNKKDLEHSSKLGQEISNLLDISANVSGITSGKLKDEIKIIGIISKHGEDNISLSLTAGWGNRTKSGVMPGKGKIIERNYNPEEIDSIKVGAKALGIDLEKAVSLLGEKTLDIYLNENTYWKNIPTNVWEYHIGGYQVIKKWLSYRERKVLGRDLIKDEARYVTEMARRIAAILLLQPQLNENYERIKTNTYNWQT